MSCQQNISCFDQPLIPLDECAKCQYDFECNKYDVYFTGGGELSRTYSRYMSLTSGIITMLCGFFFLLHPKFQKHPYRIYALANLSEGLMYINGFYTNFTCNLHLPQIMTYTLSVFGRSASPAVSNLNHMHLLQFMNKFAYELGIHMNMYWNGIILLDVT